jgi:type VI secretion system secreted protein VgrG
MALFEGIESQLELAVSVASGELLGVRQFTVHEGMSSLFVVSLVAVSENPNVDFDGTVGEPARFTVRAGSAERAWSGVCNQLQQVRVEEHGLSTYHLTLVPTLWLATQRRNHRIFQQLSELDIVLALLAEWGIEPEQHLSGKYKKRKYRVQYAESDFAFMSRMLEDVGISYHFEQYGDETKLVLSDAPETRAPRAIKLPFRDNPTGAMVDYVTAVRIGKQVRPGRYTMRDHDYRLPADYELLASAGENGGGIEQRLEQFHYTPGAFLFGSDKGEDTPNADDHGKTRTDEGEASTLAQKRLAARRESALVCTFESKALDLEPGVVMSMLDHPRADLGENENLLIVETTVSGTVNTMNLACEARSAASPYRPPLHTAKPKVVGVESATVVGPKGEEIHTDEFGRVRVQFHWDRQGKMDENSSCWIHVSQPWGGTGYGGTNLPRVGQEVLVDFLGADPDRPIITGRVYTNLQKVPYKLPDHKTRSTWKSDTSPGSNGFNEIMYEDLKGEELVWQQAQKNQRRLVKNDEVITVGNDRAKLVKNNEVETTLANRTRVTGQDHTEITGQNEAAKIGQDMSKLIGGNEVRRTQGNRQRTVDQDEDVVIGQNRRETIGSDSDSTVGGALAQAIGAARSLLVGGDDQTKVGGKHAVDAGNEIHLKSGQLFVLEAGARLSIKGPAGFIDFHSGGIDIVGDLVRINSGGSPADGSGSNPAAPDPASQANPPDPPVPVMDDVSKTGIAQ